MRRYPDLTTRALRAAHIETTKLAVSCDCAVLAKAADNRAAYIGLAVSPPPTATVLQMLTDTGWGYVTATFPADMQTSDTPVGVTLLGADKLDRCRTLYPNLQFRLI